VTGGHSGTLQTVELSTDPLRGRHDRHRPARSAPRDRHRRLPQRDAAFSTRALGLRLVKQAVNFDAPNTYHLCYGDERGRPASILTSFPWPDVPRRARAPA
jgi:catechol 2,3-dioxygenase-like lactoylglutathione lyase family enzyme